MKKKFRASCEPLFKNVQFLYLLLVMVSSFIQVQAQNCTANAGGNATVCGSTTTLNGAVSGTLGAGTPTWTFISGPTTPTIVSPNTLSTSVTGMTSDGAYVFRLSRACGTGTSTSNVTITAHPRPATFTAGADIAGTICASVGTTPLAGVIPAGFSGSWSAVNVYNFERFGNTANVNSTFSSTTSATPNFTLTNKANHTEDPAYWAILKITSTDGICTYSDTTVVRFCPMPLIPQNAALCFSSSASIFTDYAVGTPVIGSNTSGSSGNVANGTTISINVSSQPAGANMAFDYTEVSGVRTRIYFTGATIPGVYTYTITTTNCCGSTTSAPVTFTHNGYTANALNFQPVGHAAPEQMVLYSFGDTGGEVHCGIAGTATPENFYFDINALDPATTVTTVASSGILPAGATTPTVVISGAGTMSRTASVTPGPEGWKVGTYRFTFIIGSSPCLKTQVYFIHISDNSRVPLAVADKSICYPGTGGTTATINLPAVYQGVVNTSYFQEFSGYYNFAVVSKPTGSGTPTYTATNLRKITSTTTTISNLTTPGDYVFSLTAFNGSGVGAFLEQEYACSGISSLTTNFTVHVEPLINSNAGSDQTFACSSLVNLQGNSAGTGTGLWSVVSVPAGATTPTIVSPTNQSSLLSGINTAGAYTLRWTITSQYGGCISSDDVVVTLNAVSPNAPVPTATTLANTCPTASVNLNSLLPAGTLPAGQSYEWHTVNINPQAADLVGTPTAVTTSGTYYLYIISTVGSCDSPASSAVTTTVITCCNAGTVAPILIKN